MESKFEIHGFLTEKTYGELLEGVRSREILRRKERKISRKRLTELSGVSYASIRRFESKGLIAFPSLLKILIALGLGEEAETLFSHKHYDSLEEMKRG